MTSDVAISAPETAAANGHGEAHTTAGFGALTLGSIGVVYGDIGTSPLYAFREAVMAASGAEGGPTPAGGHRRGGWRHRHQPALRVPRGGDGGLGRGRRADARGRPRRGVADPVGADRR